MRGSVYSEAARRVSPLAIGVVVLLSVSCNSTETPSTWTASQITVDGDIEDWEMVPALVFEEEGASLRIANDSTSLYLLLQLRDPRMANLIRFSGLTIWLNDEGNKNKQFMLRYRGGPSMAEMRTAGVSDSLPGGERGERPGPMFDTLTSFTCQIEERIVEKEIPEDGGEGPAVGSGVSGGVIVYEFVVPLKQPEVLSYGLGVEPGQEVGIGLIWGEIDREQMRKGMRDMGGPGIGGTRGGPRGSGPPGGGFPGGGRRRPPQLPEKQEVWLKAQLAQGSASTP